MYTTALVPSGSRTPAMMSSMPSWLPSPAASAVNLTFAAQSRSTWMRDVPPDAT
jgi:hypothetical protein